MHEVKILVVGHLPSDDNLSGIRSRDQDISESARRKWSTTTALILPVYRALGQLVDTTYCPSTVRHHDTAKLMTASLGIEKPIADYRLNNIDYGEYKGKALKCTPPAHEALIKPYLGGESWLDMASRWREFFSEKMEHHSGCCILLAGQSPNSIRMLRHICDGEALSSAVGRPLEHVQFFKPESEQQALYQCKWRYSW